MPNQLAGSEESDGRAVFLHVGDYGDFGWNVAVEQRVADRSPVAFAEMTTETEQIGIAQLLATKDHDRMFIPNTLEFCCGRFIKGLSKVDAGNEGAECL